MARFFKKSQVNLEHLLLGGLILIVLIPMVYFMLSSLNFDLKYHQADDVVTTLATNVDHLSILGPVNKKPSLVRIPSGITGSVVKGKVISVELDGKTEPMDIVKNTHSDLIGGFSTITGRHFISVKVINETLVRIGEGLLLFGISPECVTVNDLPLTVTLFGDEFTEETYVLKNGEVNSTGTVEVLSTNYITFEATPGLFLPHPKGEAYTITVKDGKAVSNPVYFYVYPANHYCGAENPTQAAYLYDRNTHTNLEEITTVVSEDDGYTERVDPDEVVQLVTQSNLKKGDFIQSTFRCRQNGTVSIFEDGTTSPILGFVSCIGDQWLSRRIFILGTAPVSNKWDIGSDVIVDYDYISGRLA